MQKFTFKIRIPSTTKKRGRKYLTHLLLVFLLGLSLGFLAKYLDNVPIIGEMGTNFGVWIFIVTLISCYSQSPLFAWGNIFVFFLSMLLAYYAYTYYVLHFLPIQYIKLWAMLAVLSSFLAPIIWFGKGSKWTSAIISSLPISLLIIEGMPFFYTKAYFRLFDLIFAAILYFCLANPFKQKLRLLFCNLVVFLIYIFINFLNTN
ncbi:UNVERIFIED_ORG: hypothetical protein ABRZ91_003340 [Heyndrickxia coagulans]